MATCEQRWRPYMSLRFNRFSATVLLCLLPSLILLPGCTIIMTSATSSLASSLTEAMLEQDDPDTVREAVPAYLLMLDSFILSSPNSSDMLQAGAALYAAYGVVFVDDPDRSKLLTRKAKTYGERALCTQNKNACALTDAVYDDYIAAVSKLTAKDVQAMYSHALSWVAYIQAHSDEWDALADLPQVQRAFERIQELDPAYEPGSVQHYLGVLNTIRSPALGGDFEAGRDHYERALELSGGHDLSIKVDYARYYARTLYDRELHDRLLGEVVAADPYQPGYTLFNTLAQRQARTLLDSADEYF